MIRIKHFREANLTLSAWGGEAWGYTAKLTDLETQPNDKQSINSLGISKYLNQPWLFSFHFKYCAILYSAPLCHSFVIPFNGLGGGPGINLRYLWWKSFSLLVFFYRLTNEKRASTETDVLSTGLVGFFTQSIWATGSIWNCLYTKQYTRKMSPNDQKSVSLRIWARCTIV